MRRLKLDVTTAADGTATAFFQKVSGKLHAIHYIKDGTVPFADGVDFTITAERTGEGVWSELNINASTVRYPRAPLHTQAGAAVLYAAGGTPVVDKIAVADDRIKVVIAQGGNAKKGHFLALVD